MRHWLELFIYLFALFICIGFVFAVKQCYGADSYTTYAGDTLVIWRESELGAYYTDDTICVLKVIARDNGRVDIYTCGKELIRLDSKQFLRRK